MQDYKVNPWVSFLRQYGPIPRNDNMYDESIQRAIRRKRIRPLQLETPHLAELISELRVAAPASVLLTGTAGDGKTYLCREVWTALGGSIADWESDGKIRSLALPCGAALTVVKDLSEFRGRDYDLLARMAHAVRSPQSEEVFLIAANDGQLIEAWNRAPIDDDVAAVRAVVEDLLVSDECRRTGFRLKLYNLSRNDSGSLFAQVIRAITEHSGWDDCGDCRGQEPEHRCPVWENRERFRHPALLDRLSHLLELCDLNGHHLPIRQLLLLASNALLGHPDAKEGLLTCADVPGVVRKNRASEGSVYSNLFGGNLSPGRRASTDVIELLNRFGIGEETSNRIDNVLVFGSDQPDLKPIFDRVVRSDGRYGAHPEFLRLQSAYIEGLDAQAAADFLESLPCQRRRLFLTMPPADAEELRLWELTVFQFAGEYLERVLRPMRRGEKAPRPILCRLIQGMNRIFTGLLSTTNHELVLASSGSFSQARVSRIQEYSIPMEPRKGERISLEYMKGHLLFAVYFDQNRSVSLPLSVLRYEFLSRVADGALPSSFSRECYEDVLSFKSRLLRAWLDLRTEYGEVEVPSDEMRLQLLELDSRGKLATKALTVRL